MTTHSLIHHGDIERGRIARRLPVLFSVLINQDVHRDIDRLFLLAFIRRHQALAAFAGDGMGRAEDLQRLEAGVQIHVGCEEIDKLADKVIREPFENIDPGIIDELERNDILFIDNSHRILPNSDSLVFFLEILPRLKQGVIVQMHDIYLPYDYPQFMCNRYYSEQYGLAMFLLANPEKYETLLPNYYISEDSELSGLLSPIWENNSLVGVERHGGSFWLRINE